MKGPTHEKGRTLDLVFTKDPTVTVSVSDEISDHRMLKVRTSMHCLPAKCITNSSWKRFREIISFSPDKWQDLNNAYNCVDWSFLSDGKNIDEMEKAWREVVLNTAKTVMGTRRKVYRGHRTALDCKAKEAYEELRRLHKATKKAGVKEKEKLIRQRKKAFKKFRNELARCRKQERETQSNQLKQADGVGSWWKRVRSITGNEAKQRIPTLQTAEGVSSLPKQKAEVLNKSFCKNNLKVHTGEPPKMLRRVPPRVSLRNMLITPTMVRQELIALKQGKATGPDQIPQTLLFSNV